jgi:hypothetical protein
MYRCPMRSGKWSDRAAHTRQIEHVLEQGIVGIGWGYLEDPPTTLAQALEQAENAPWPGWGRNAANTIKRFANAADDSLIWTLHTDGRWLLGRMHGPWRPDYSEAAIATDVHQVRHCQWAPRPLLSEEVPGAVIRAFSGIGSSFSRILSWSGRVYSRALFAELTGEKVDLPKPSAEEIVRDHLDPFDVEDLVFTYLQVVRGFLVLPASRKTNNPAYEWSVIDRQEGGLIPVSIKTGAQAVDVSMLASTAEDTETAYAYSTNGHYTGDGQGHVETIDTAELLAFAEESPHLLPPRVRRWMEQASG